MTINTPKRGYCPVRSSTVSLSHMTAYLPDSPGAILAKLAYLRFRKAALDELILSLERYAVYELPQPKKIRAESADPARARRLAGAA
jgi:hypothetical protein